MANFFHSIRRNIRNKIEQKKEIQEKKKLEDEMIEIFTKYAQDIKARLVELNKSPQLLNAVALIEVFREMCQKIAEDDELGNPQRFRFLNAVRKWDRELEHLVEDMKYRFEYDNPEKFRVEARKSTDWAEYIFENLKTVVSDYKDRMEERQRLRKQRLQMQRQNQKQTATKTKEKETETSQEQYDDYIKYGEKPPLKLRIEHWINQRLRPEELSENREKIEEFRKNMTEEQEKKIEETLSLKDEVEIAKEFIDEVFSLLESYEEMSYYEHVSQLGKLWLQFLEDLSDKIRTPKEEHKLAFQDKTIPKLLQVVREHFIFVEDWLQRVDLKYENE